MREGGRALCCCVDGTQIHLYGGPLEAGNGSHGFYGLIGVHEKTAMAKGQGWEGMICYYRDTRGIFCLFACLHWHCDLLLRRRM